MAMRHSPATLLGTGHHYSSQSAAGSVCAHKQDERRRDGGCRFNKFWGWGVGWCLGGASEGALNGGLYLYLFGC